MAEQEFCTNEDGQEEIKEEITFYTERFIAIAGLFTDTC